MKSRIFSESTTSTLRNSDTSHGCEFEMARERPPAAFGGWPHNEGRLFYPPHREGGQRAKRGRGSLKLHFDRAVILSVQRRSPFIKCSSRRTSAPGPSTDLKVCSSVWQKPWHAVATV